MSKGKEGIGERLFLGAVGGIVGTWAMTLSMRSMFRRLPPGDRYPLPPREITEVVLGSNRDRRPADRPVTVQTLAAHFGYGAATGSLFTLADLHRSYPVSRGMAWGVGVWAGSYFGIMPALGILAPASRHPYLRNALMIAAHLVWGAGLGLTARTLQESMDPFANRRGRLLPDQAAVNNRRKR